MKIKKNCLYQIEGEGGWASHSTAYSFENKGEIILVNTYGDPEFQGVTMGRAYSDPIIYYPEAVSKKITFLFKLEDLKEVSEDDWWHYNDEDRINLPMGRFKARYLVNKHKDKNIQFIIDDVKFKIESRRNQIESAKRDIIELSKKLEELEKKKR